MKYTKANEMDEQILFTCCGGVSVDRELSVLRKNGC